MLVSGISLFYLRESLVRSAGDGDDPREYVMGSARVGCYIRRTVSGSARDAVGTREMLSGLRERCCRDP